MKGSDIPMEQAIVARSRTGWNSREEELLQQAVDRCRAAGEPLRTAFMEAAKETGRNIGTGVFNLAGNGKAMTAGENEGLVKLVFDKDTEEILGCHMVGPRVTDMIAEVSAVMESEGTITELGRAVHPHPTVSEAVMEAAHACHGNSVNAPKAR